MHPMPLEGTYLVWVDCRELNIDVDTLCERLLNEYGVWVNPGTMYGPQSGQGFIRINIACPRTQLMEGLRRIAKMFSTK
jgi:cystathionine beta-lyase